MNEKDKQNRSYEDRGELDIYKIFDLLWKNKGVIILTVLFFSATTFLISYFLITPKYEISTTVAPGWIGRGIVLRVGEKSKPIYLDTVENLRSYLDNQSYKHKLICKLNLNPEKYSEELEFDVYREAHSRSLHIYYYTPDPDLGVKIFDTLIEIMRENYASRINRHKEVINEKIERDENKIQSIRTEIKRLKKKIENNIDLIKNEKKEIKQNIELEKEKLNLLKKRNKEIESQLKKVKKNTRDILNQRTDLLSEAKKQDPVSLVLFSNTIQQNLHYTNKLLKQLADIREERATVKNKIDKLKLKLTTKDKKIKIDRLKTKFNDKEIAIKNLESKIKAHKAKKEAVEGIKVFQEPSASYEPVKPKHLLNTIIGGAGALFLSILFILFRGFLREFESRGY